jgi:hypothetical protein
MTFATDTTFVDDLDVDLLALEANGERFDVIEGRAVPFDVFGRPHVADPR